MRHAHGIIISKSELARPLVKSAHLDRVGCILCLWMFARPVTNEIMLVTLILFFASAIAIYLACEFFVNGVEWVGKRLNFGQTAVGTVLAAFGTALPESAVTFFAAVFGKDAHQKDIGVGAAMGGPLVLATIAYGIVGFSLWYKRYREKSPDYLIQGNYNHLAKDQLSFLVIFAFKVALGLVAFTIKPWLGILFLMAYGFYVWREINSEEEDEGEELEDLKIRPHNPTLFWSGFQTLAALVVIAIASQTFVHQLESIGEFAGLPPHIIALLLSPVATELPETMNAIIWVRQGKERLALANISGSMMIQATIPSAIGIMATKWMFDTTLVVAAGVTFVAMTLLYFMFKRGKVDSRLLGGIGLLYAVFGGWMLFH